MLYHNEGLFPLPYKEEGEQGSNAFGIADFA